MSFSAKVLRSAVLGVMVALATLIVAGPAGARPAPSNATILLRLTPAVGPPGAVVSVSGRYLGCAKVMITFQPRAGVSSILGTADVRDGQLLATVRIPRTAPAGAALIRAEGSNPWLCSGTGTFFVMCPGCDGGGPSANEAARPSSSAISLGARG